MKTDTLLAGFLTVGLLLTVAGLLLGSLVVTVAGGGAAGAVAMRRLVLKTRQT